MQLCKIPMMKHHVLVVNKQGMVCRRDVQSVVSLVDQW